MRRPSRAGSSRPWIVPARARPRIQVVGEGVEVADRARYPESTSVPILLRATCSADPRGFDPTLIGSARAPREAPNVHRAVSRRARRVVGGRLRRAGDHSAARDARPARAAACLKQWRRRRRSWREPPRLAQEATKGLTVRPTGFAWDNVDPRFRGSSRQLPPATPPARRRRGSRITAIGLLLEEPRRRDLERPAPRHGRRPRRRREDPHRGRARRRGPLSLTWRARTVRRTPSRPRSRSRPPPSPSSAAAPTKSKASSTAPATWKRPCPTSCSAPSVSTRTKSTTLSSASMPILRAIQIQSRQAATR